MSELSSFEELEKEIETIKDEFYSESGKNRFFKNSQKYDCAKKIVSKISLDVLLNRTCLIIDDANCVHIDYPIMKTYASPEIFELIAEYIFDKFEYLETTYPTFEVALNLDGFSVSAAERYKILIEIFYRKCFQRNTGFSLVVTQFVVYNAPSVIDTIKHIVPPFIEDHMKHKLFIVPKKESEQYNQRFADIHS